MLHSVLSTADSNVLHCVMLSTGDTNIVHCAISGDGNVAQCAIYTLRLLLAWEGGAHLPSYSMATPKLE